MQVTMHPGKMDINPRDIGDGSFGQAGDRHVGRSSTGVIPTCSPALVEQIVRLLTRTGK